MESCLYVGRVSHQRYTPVTHAFSYRVFMLYLDLAELERVFRGRWLFGVERRALASFRRRDHLGDPRVPLDRAVRDAVEAATGRRPAGPVRLLTMLRSLGYGFKPVSLAYCFDAPAARVEAVVADVTNTPWNERHTYVVPAPDDAAPGAALTHRSQKAFHVSPFLPMELDYAWRLTMPGERLEVSITCLRDGRALLEAGLALERRAITGRSLATALLRHPFMTGKTAAAIYWQALGLALRRAPFFPHPAARPEHTEIARS